MGLFDGSRRARSNHASDRELSPDDWKRIGRLEAEVESLRLQWASYRDELHRLVQRLEKRDQRAAERERAAPPVPSEPERDPTTERVLARRRGRHGIPEQREG